MKVLIILRQTLAGAAIAIALGACGNLPKPFEPIERNSIPLPESPSTLGIGIIPPATMDLEAGKTLAEDIAAQLTQLDIPAEPVDRVGLLGFSLQGQLNQDGKSETNSQFSFEWRLLDRAGKLVETFNQSLPITTPVATVLTEELSHQIAQDIASRIANSLGPSLPEIPPSSLLGEGLSVIIIPPPSAPGDGAVSLVRTLANRLAQQGFSPAADDPDFQLIGAVEVRPYDAAQDDIAIAWRVLNAQGEDLGEVRLDNRIPRGELDGAWGLIAEAIVDSAFPGLMEIVASSAEQTRNQ